MRLTKIHRVLRFRQSPGMEPYIWMNTELRKRATSDFEKDLYKIMNNSVFGKTMENLRKQRRQAQTPYRQPGLCQSEHLWWWSCDVPDVFNRPVYMGMSILDISKHLMYDFYYNQLKVGYGECCKLLYTDTDSLLLAMQTEDVYKDLAKHPDLYDTSDLLKDHPLHSIVNKKVLGKMKDKCAERLIAEYVSLRPKMYSILEASGANIKKGVKKATVKKHIRHEQYKEAWMSCGQSAIASVGNIWTRYHSRPLTPSAGSQKMGWTHWLMDTKIQSPQAVVPTQRWMSCSTLENRIWRLLGVGGTTRSSSLTKPRGGPSCK